MLFNPYLKNQTQTSVLQSLFLMNQLKKKRFGLGNVLKKCEVVCKEPKFLNIKEVSRKLYLEQYYQFSCISYSSLVDQLCYQSKLCIINGFLYRPTNSYIAHLLLLASNR